VDFGICVYNEIKSILNDEILRNAIVGFIVERIDGNVIFQYNADIPLIPASNMKIITGLAGLLYLGPDFIFKTKIFLEGLKDNEASNIYIVGSADPTLTDEETFALWCTLSMNYGAENVISSSIFRNIKEVKGDIVVDESLFDDEYYNKEWDPDDAPQPYAAQISALTINRNSIILKIESDDKEIKVHEIPNIDYLHIINEIKIGERDEIKIERYIESNDIYLKGTLLPHTVKYINTTVNDPALYTGYVFRNMLKRAGVIVRGKVRKGIMPNQFSPFKTIESKRLSIILQDMMKHSINLYAEQIAKLVTVKFFNKGSWKNWNHVVNHMLNELNINNNSIVIVDGSGLSHKNRLTPRIIVEILRKVYELPSNIKNAFINSLPISGIDGTLKNRMKGTVAEGKVKAKTGTLHNVSALSGYIEIPNKETLVFSFIANNITSPDKVKFLEDKIVNILITLYR
jgi:D-alanyl-D-alanine carboxypeptidase/D-alanyl-D-alanine-endopeptidase (penicillin-binding protein 4)